MTTFRYRLACMLLVGFPLLFSCTEHDELDYTGNTKGIVFSVDKFKDANDSRTSVDVVHDYQIVWSPGDVVGVFPREGYQEPFTIPAEQIGQSQAVFDGGYWSLKDGLTYAAYYPFDKAYFESPATKTKIAVSYAGQQQTGTECSVGGYDYTYSDWMTSEFGSINLKMHHIGAFVILRLPIPVTTNYTSLELSTTESIIPVAGHYDLTATQSSIVADQLASSVSLQLNEFTGTADHMAELYMMLPPVDLNQKILTFTLSANGGTCVYTIPGKAINASTRYIINPRPISSTVPGTTDEWLRKYGIIEDNTATIHVSTAGQLSQLISAERKYKIERLKLTGKLNDEDFKFIREMTGLDVQGNNTAGILKHIDLSEVRIIGSQGKEVTYLSTSMFHNTNIESVILPSSVKELSGELFKGCKMLKDISPIDQLESISGSVFEQCTGLTEIIFSDRLRFLGDLSFIGCTNLLNVRLPKNKGFDHIGVGTFSNCHQLASITIPESVTVLCNGAFYACKSFTSIRIPESVFNIGMECFMDCSNLNEIVFSSNITTVTKSAFENCTNLSKISLSEKVVSIEDFAFKNCPNLELTCLATTPPSIGVEALAPTCKIYVPKGFLDIYKKSKGWESFAANMYEIDNNDAGGIAPDFEWGN